MATRPLRPSEAHRAIREIGRVQNQSLHMASLTLPLNRRQAVRAIGVLYRELCGCPLADSCDPQELRRRLNDWRIWLLRTDPPRESPVQVALYDTLHKLNVPVEPLLALVEGIEERLRATKRPLREAVLARTELLGAPLGELMLVTLKGRQEKALPYARLLGQAVILTDVITLMVEQVRSGEAGQWGAEQPLIPVIAELAHKADLMFEAAHGGVRYLHAWHRPFVRSLSVLHRARLVKIYEGIDDRFAQPIGLSHGERIWLGTWAFLGLLDDGPGR